MKNKKLNGLAKWILVGLAIATIAYNTIVAHVISKNEIKHLQRDMQEVKLELRDLRQYLMENK